MIYRLVRLTNNTDYAQIYNEETSELLGAIIKTRRMLFFRQYQLRVGEKITMVNRSLLNGRKWKLQDKNIKFSLFGQSISISDHSSKILGKGFNRGKYTLITETGRSMAIIDPSEFKSKEFVIVEDFDRDNQEIILLVALLILERYKQW